MPSRPLSKDLKPGMQLRFPRENVVYTIDRRKTPEDFTATPFEPGWWLVGGGGFADHILDHPDRKWRIVPQDNDVRLVMLAAVAWLHEHDLGHHAEGMDEIDRDELAKAIDRLSNAGGSGGNAR